jgi:hypothetical protein
VHHKQNIKNLLQKNQTPKTTFTSFSMFKYFTMKQITQIFAIIFISMAGLSASAQQAGELSKRVQKELAILNNADLNLSSEQLHRLTLVLKAEDDILAMNEKAAQGDKAVLELRIKEIKAHKLNNVLGAMTPKQAEKFMALKLDQHFK